MAELRVLTWNVLADPYVRAEYFPLADPAWLRAGARDAAVADVLAAAFAAGVDVACLQEATAALAAGLGRLGRVLWCPKGAGRPDGCAVVVAEGRWRVLSHERHEFADGTGHVRQHVRLEGEAAVEIVNTHLRWTPPDMPPAERPSVREARALAALPGPLVLCGDLNDRPDGPVLAALTGAGFADATPHVAASAVANGQAKRLDYVLTRGREASGGELWAPCGPPDPARGLPDAACPSDHLPLWAQLRV